MTAVPSGAPTVADVIAQAAQAAEPSCFAFRPPERSPPQKADDDVEDDDSEPPMAPPEDESDGEPPWAPSETSVEEYPVACEEPKNAPLGAPIEESCISSSNGDPDSLGVALVKEVYAGSSGVGSELALDAVRALHPFWDQAGKDSAIGRQVTWARCSNDWVYGELSLDSWPLLLAQCGPKSTSDVFVDLGCGTGKVTALAALHFSRVFGLELQQELLDHAGKLANTFRARARRQGVGVGELGFHRADFLGRLTSAWSGDDGKPWWELADVAYACSPKFSEATMQSLADLAAGMRSGCRFATVRHGLKSPHLEELWRGSLIFSWGRDDLIVHRRR